LEIPPPTGLAAGFFDPALGAALGFEGKDASSAAKRASFSAFFFAISSQLGLSGSPFPISPLPLR